MPSLRGLGAAALIGSATLGVNAGDLDPPGAPVSTPGPEPRIALNQENTPGDDEAHFLITAPGSYYLPESFTASTLSTSNGIVIEAGDVTIDLNGFTLDGFNGRTIGPLGFLSNDTLTGIRASGEVENITIRNGTVRDWGDDGINLSSASSCLVEGIRASENGDEGICTGNGAVVSHCVAESNGGTGIRVIFDGTVSDCVSRANTGHGIQGLGAVIRGCVAGTNGRDGINGNRVLVSDCIASLNSGQGIRVEFNSIVMDNIAHNNNSGAGISVSGTSNQVRGNNTVSNAVGIQVSDDGNVIIQNTARSNDTEYDIVAGNTVGPILPVADPITSTNPWANFSL